MADTNKEEISNVDILKFEDKHQDIFKIHDGDSSYQTIGIPYSEQQKIQYVVFHKIMKRLLSFGQFIAIIPVTGYSNEDPLKHRFNVRSFRFLFSLFVFVSHFFKFICCCKYIIKNPPLTVRHIGFLVFLLATSTFRATFMKTATQWPDLVKKVYADDLPIDPSVTFRCLIYLCTIGFFAVLENLLWVLSNITRVLDCTPELGFEGYIIRTFAYMDDFKPTNIAAVILLQWLRFLNSMDVSFPDIFIISISIYLSSIFQEINKKIIWGIQKDVPPSYWRSLRNKYTRAAKLVRTFDAAISHTTFVWACWSCFFVCLKLFYLSKGFNTNMDVDCPYYPSGPFNGFEHTVYFIFSLSLVLLKFVLVIVTAGTIYSSSKKSASLLYQVPNRRYCEEVQRFIEQVHSDTIALTGLGFFHLSRDMILTIAGNIITYELVLVQFQDDIH